MYGQSQANQTNIRLANQANAFELAMWKRNNEYNTPAQQMGRLVKAGLNPNLMYGQGASTGLSSTMPRAHVATVQNELQDVGAAPLQALSMMQDMKVKQAQIENLENNADFTLSKTINESIKGRLMEAGISEKNWNVRRIEKLLPYSMEAQQENINMMRTKNRDILWKVNSLNPESLRNIQMKNKSLGLDIENKKFNNYALNPAKLRNLNFKNETLKFNLNKMLPELYQLRSVNNSLLRMKESMNKTLNPYNATERDNPLLRLFLNTYDGILKSLK